MLTPTDIQYISKVDFEGLENITKFKYRKSKPKYPKPGTFYWIEESIDSIKKCGIYYTTNEKEFSEELNQEIYKLIRLDSKIYDLVVRDSDDPHTYIHISEPNEFDTQELYLTIGNFVKEDDTIDGVRVFHITLDSGNQGLATVEGVVEYISDSNNILYQSNVEEYWKVGKRLGDVKEGDNKSTLKNNTISEILDKVLYPTLQPEIIQPSVLLSEQLLKDIFYENEENKNIEVKDNHILIKYTPQNIEILNNLLEKFKTPEELSNYIVCDRGHVTFPTAEMDENGDLYTLHHYAGKVLQIESKCTDKVKTDGGNRYEFCINVTFDSGVIPLDNKRNPAIFENHVCDDTCLNEEGETCETKYIPRYEGGIVQSNKLIVDIVSPIYTNAIQHNNIRGIYEILEYPTLVNYCKEEGDEIILEFPSERDGFDNNLNDVYKMCLEIPYDNTSEKNITFKVYQYNEFTKDYDIEIEFYDLRYPDGYLRDFIKHGEMFYKRYMRGFKFDKERGIYIDGHDDTNVKPVKYKIIIKRD